MSGQTPVNPQSRELEVLRVLFDRHLLERAVSLAESRWPGSGDMVRLAYDWSQLAPAERRERLSAIGPEDIARLRELAELNPELDAVIQDLDQRGVLPHVEQMAASGVAAATVASASRATVEPAVSTPLTEPAAEPVPDVPAEVQAQVEAVNVAAQQRIDELRREVGEIERMDPAQLAAEAARRQADSQQVAQFLSTEEARRQQAVADAEAAMQRVHQRLDRLSNKLLGAADVKAPSLLPLDVQPLQPAAGPAAATAAGLSGLLAGAPPRLVAAPERLAREFADQVVISLADDELYPTGDELIALANELGLALREFTITPGSTRAVFGTLTRNGQRIETKAGPLPSALARETLAVVRGKLYPDLIMRMEAGYADIPGTRATVKMHPKSRVLVLAD